MERLRLSHLLGSWAATHSVIRRRLGVVRRMPTAAANEFESWPRPSAFWVHEAGTLGAVDAPNVDPTASTVPVSLAFGLRLRETVVEAAQLFDTLWRDTVLTRFLDLIRPNQTALRQLYDLLPQTLATLDMFTHEVSHGQTRWLSAIVHANDFMRAYENSTAVGRAAMLERATEGRRRAPAIG